MHMLTWLTIKKLPWMLALGIAAAAPAHPLDLFTVSGECQVTGRGLLRVFLVDEWSFSVPLSGINTTTITLHASGPRIRRVAFAFIVPQGTYGLRCLGGAEAHCVGACTEGPAAPKSEGGQFRRHRHGTTGGPRSSRIPVCLFSIPTRYRGGPESKGVRRNQTVSDEALPRPEEQVRLWAIVN
jgi:hypothetical protein